MFEIDRSDLPQLQVSPLRERHPHASVVIRVNRPLQKPKSYHSSHEFYRGVMPDKQKSGELADKHRRLTGKPLDGKERLILS